MFRKNSTSSFDSNNIDKTPVLSTGYIPVAEGNTSIQEATPKFTRFLIGTYIDPVKNEWMIAYTQFDPVLKVTGEVTVERVSGDLEVMKERLVIKQGMLGILEAGEFTQERKMEIY